MDPVILNPRRALSVGHPVAKLPGIEVVWKPRYRGAEAFTDAETLFDLPDLATRRSPPGYRAAVLDVPADLAAAMYDDIPGGMGWRWAWSPTEQGRSWAVQFDWEGDPAAFANVRQPSEGEWPEWWRRAWIRMELRCDDPEFDKRARKLLHRESTSEEPLHRRFGQLAQLARSSGAWPVIEDPAAILGFAAQYGPLLEPESARSRSRVVPFGDWHMAERAVLWFTRTRMIEAIRLILWLGRVGKQRTEGEQPRNVTNLWDANLRRLSDCCLEIIQSNNKCPGDFWHWRFQGDLPKSLLLESVRADQSWVNEFNKSAKRAFAECMVMDAQAFKPEFDVERSVFKIQATTLLGAIYASLYEDLMRVDGNRTCEHCGTRFWGRPNKKFCKTSHGVRFHEERRKRLSPSGGGALNPPSEPPKGQK